MEQRIHARPLTAGAFVLLSLMSLILLEELSGLVFATQPPPPQTYFVTVNKDGGDDNCCQVRIVSPGGTAWSSTSVQGGPYLAGTMIEVDAKAECPCGYYFDKWDCNDDSELDHDPHHHGYFNINKNTVAMAVFKPYASFLKIYVMALHPVALIRIQAAEMWDTLFGSSRVLTHQRSHSRSPTRAGASIQRETLTARDQAAGRRGFRPQAYFETTRDTYTT